MDYLIVSMQGQTALHVACKYAGKESFISLIDIFKEVCTDMAEVRNRQQNDILLTNKVLRIMLKAITKMVWYYKLTDTKRTKNMRFYPFAMVYRIASFQIVVFCFLKKEKKL